MNGDNRKWSGPCWAYSSPMVSCRSVNVAVPMEGQQWERIASSFQYQQSSCGSSGVKGHSSPPWPPYAFIFFPYATHWVAPGEQRYVWHALDRRWWHESECSHLPQPSLTSPETSLHTSTLLEQLCFSSAKTFGCTVRPTGQLHEWVCMVLSSSCILSFLLPLQNIETRVIKLLMGKFCCFSLYGGAACYIWTQWPRPFFPLQCRVLWPLILRENWAHTSIFCSLLFPHLNCN